MTVALGLVCSDGVIVASDSQGTSDHQTAAPSIKVNLVTGLPVVWTASGAVYCIEEVQNDTDKWNTHHKLRNAVIQGDLPAIREQISSAVHKVLKAAYQSALPLGERQINPQTGAHAFSTSFLFLGWSADAPWFLEVDGSGQLNWHTDKRFTAVGSGGAFAEVAGAVLGHLIEGEDLSLEMGKRVAYRAIETTCNVSSALVGGDVQLGVVDKDGAKILDKAEVSEVHDAVAGWKQMERELLRGQLGGGSTENLPDIEDQPSDDPSTTE